jgi:diguanylate cyclase (GGDEF)-like protein
VFRAMGRYAFDLPEVEAKSTAEVCERWATHLLVRSPVPDGPWDQGDASTRTMRREFVNALHYVTNLRKTEHGYLSKSLHDLRHAIWAFVHSLNQTLSTDGDASGRVKAQLSRLHEAARSSSTDDLKREAINAAQTIGEIIEERQRQQVAQVATLGERMATLGRALEEARREVGLDSLTQLCNRKTFNEQIARVADLSSVFKQPACLLIVDVDHFKSVNDNHGHPAGDEVLRRLSDCLVRTFRRRDDVVARFGGDEFAVILRETELREGILLCERLLDAVRSMAIDHGGEALRITVSIGMCQAKAGESAERWIERADRALYDAKERGRDRVAYSVPPS